MAYARVFLVMGLCVASACGGRSVERPAGGESPADAGPDAPELEGADCVCPAVAPNPERECACPGLECGYSPYFCWHGDALCSADGRWQRPNRQNPSCPSEVPRPTALCGGEGSCRYEVDVGCGPAELTLTCTCMDATWHLSRAETPALCDCQAIGSQNLCRLYPDCAWVGEPGRCEPAAPAR